MLNVGYLASQDGTVAIAYSHRPFVDIWHQGEASPLSINLQHPSFSQLTVLDNRFTFTHPRPQVTRLARYAAGLAIASGHVFVALDLPWVQIQEFDFRGNKIDEYSWLGDKPIMRYFGFDIDEQQRTAIIGASFGSGAANRVVTLRGLR